MLMLLERSKIWKMRVAEAMANAATSNFHKRSKSISFSVCRRSRSVSIKLDKAVAGEDFPLSVTWAHGFEPTLGYHGGSGRGCFSVEPKQ